MSDTALYPLRFEPIFQYRTWGGRRLGSLLSAPLPGEGPIGEAWLLSDRAECSSVVADGPLEGRTLGELLEEAPVPMLGELAGRFPRFPLLLKYLDARDTLSIQVHPSDRQTDHLPAGESGKTEAWVVLETGPESRIYAGLKPATTPGDLRRAIDAHTVPECLTSFTPVSGDSILLPAGTVHSLGGTVVFEVQENSDVTFRLSDWDHIDAETGRARPLQVEEALDCLDFSQVALSPGVPVVEESTPNLRERLMLSDHFGMWRIHGESPFSVGAAHLPRMLVCLQGGGQLEHGVASYLVAKGEVFLLPAEVGICLFRPDGAATLLEISLPGNALYT